MLSRTDYVETTLHDCDADIANLHMSYVSLAESQQHCDNNITCSNLIIDASILCHYLNFNIIAIEGVIIYYDFYNQDARRCNIIVSDLELSATSNPGKSIFTN